MGKKKYIIYFLFTINFSTCSVCAAQNLVPNMSFEDITDTCVWGHLNTMEIVQNWFIPHGFGPPDCYDDSPDYHHICWDVPNIGIGYENPRTGNAFSGFYTLQLQYPNAREYIEVQLTDSLIGGEKYVVQFYVSLADNMGYVTNKIGVYFSDTAITYPCDTPILLPFVPQIINQSSNSLTNKNGWTLIKDTLIASGGEKYITIGNFFADGQCDSSYIGGGVNLWDTCCSYYYIDDVSVIPLDSLLSITESQMTNNYFVKIYPNPANEAVNIQVLRSKNLTNEEKYIARIKNSVGQNIFKKEFYKHIKIDTSQFPKGLYLIEVCTSEEQLCHTGKIILE